MKMKINTGASLNKRISMIVLIMVVSSTAIIGILGYYRYRLDSIAFGADKAMAIAQSVASAIDPEGFVQAMETGEKNSSWHEAKKLADDVKTRNNLMYLYVLDKNYGSNVTYFLEGGAPGDSNPCDLGEEESVEYHADEMFETIRTGQPLPTDIYDSEGYGMMLSGFAPILDDGNVVVGVVGVDISMDAVMKSSNAFGAMIVICVVVFSTVFWLISSLYITRNIGRPIAALSKASEKIAVGDMDVELSVHSNDEIGKLTASFQEMVNSTKGQVAVLEMLANGDLTADITPRSKWDSMGFAMKQTIDNLNAMFAEIKFSTIHVSTGAGQIADAAASLAQGASQQTSTMEGLEAVVAQVADKTKENAVKANKAATLADTIKDTAEKGSGQMDRMIQAVKEINDASHSIGKVIKVIDDIAFQTNILALNASVEAARAGQHGKGFAVVADEVRNLATKSAEAAKDTGSLISNSMEKAELGARIAGETATSLAEIVSGIGESSQIIAEIAGFSKEQTVAITKINSDIDQVVQVIQQNSATAEESSASSQELSHQSVVLQELVSKFKVNSGTPPSPLVWERIPPA